MKTPPKSAIDLSLYLVTDPTAMKNQTLTEVLGRAVQSGVSVVQLREKHCSDHDFLILAKKALSILTPHGVPLVINDRVDIALKVGAQGVHLGQSDLDWREARRLLGPGAIIGVSVENTEQALKFNGQNVDYLGVSSVFQTSTKKDVKHVWGIKGLEALRSLSAYRLVAIGGINESNVRKVMRSGADGAAIIAAICSAADPKRSATLLKEIIDEELKMRREELQNG